MCCNQFFFFCVRVFCPTLCLYLVLLLSLGLFCSISKCILMFFSGISNLLLLFFLRLSLLWSSFNYRITEVAGLLYGIVLLLFSLRFSLV